MVKSIQMRVEDAVFEKLKKLKGKKSWEQFLVNPLITEAEKP